MKEADVEATALTSTSTGHAVRDYDYNSISVIPDDVVSEPSTTKSISLGDQHKTTVWETVIHLLKGYIGTGVLSLPWAVSQLGVKGGFFTIFVVAYWSSYNGWTVVKIKRYMEQNTTNLDDKQSETRSLKSESQKSETSSNITYPDVGEYMYGTKFHSYVSISICVQQLAICTVFLSVVGENIMAVLNRIPGFTATHITVITMTLPFAMGLSLTPTLKHMAPMIAMATIFLMSGFVVLGFLIGIEWEDRPLESPTVNWPSVPLAICAILYSYEGTCLILPIESAMKEPQHFEKVFWGSMLVVSFVLASVGGLCVLAFGEVTNGSITAFLIVAYGDDDSIVTWLMIANALVSLSVLLTYPLMLFPTLEIIGPAVQRFFGSDNNKDVEDEEKDLAGFDPLPPLPEDREAEHDEYSLPEVHFYAQEPTEEDVDKEDELSQSAFSSTMISIFPELIMPGDTPQLRLGLVFLTYSVAVVVPNVQALISLVGAVAGSSTALLIPPMLELAWIRQLETDLDGDDDLISASPGHSMPGRSTWTTRGRYSLGKVKCIFLLILGFTFLSIGAYSSLADIVAIYRAGNALP
jgi:amino acid permease